MHLVPQSLQTLGYSPDVSSDILDHHAEMALYFFDGLAIHGRKLA